MAGEDEDVVINLSDDGTMVGDTDIKPVIEGEDGEVAADFNDPVEDLKSQFATMTQRATQAEQAAHQAAQRAQQAEQRAARAETEVTSSQLDTVKSGISAAEAEATSAEQAYIAAVEAGDAAAMARAQRAIATAVSRVERLKEAQDDLEQEVKVRKEQPQKAPQPPPQPRGDVVEQFASQLTPKSAEWVRAHPEVVTDRKLNARMMAAHNLAVADDVAVESAEYFRRVEEAIGAVKKQQDGGQRKANGDGTRPSSAAAPGGDRGGALRGGAREVRLTKGEAEAATDGTLVWNYPDPSGKNRWQKGDPIGLAEMARRKMGGQKAGLYDKNSIEA